MHLQIWVQQAAHMQGCTQLQVSVPTPFADASRHLRAQEKAEDYRRGQQEAGAALLQAAAVVLAPEQLQHLQYDAANGEFGLRLADTMVEWGQKHISLLDAQGRSSFLQQVCCWSRESRSGPAEHRPCACHVFSQQVIHLNFATKDVRLWKLVLIGFSAMQMLAFARQTFLLVSAAVMPFWVSLLQHSAPRATEAPRHSPLPDDAAAALLELAGAQAGAASLLPPTIPKIGCSSVW